VKKTTAKKNPTIPSTDSRLSGKDDDTLEEEIEFVSIDSNEEDLVATDSNEEHEEQVSRGDDNNQRTIEIFAFANEAQQVMFAAAKTPAGCWLGSGR
jgi:hypothetical protein